MDETRKKEIDEAWRRSRREQVFDDLRRIKLGWMMLLVAIIALVIFTSVVFSVPPSLTETVQGRIVGEFSVPSKYRPQRWRVSVQLKDGQAVRIEMPKGEILRTDTDMKLRHTRRVLGPLIYDDYRFAGYAKADG
jgi:hypothetical protein